jgi:bisphosphoglycerate-independent phosphoglycerate mutase (AlkP superfamily)
MNRKVLLMILDGWGIGDATKSDVLHLQLLLTGIA